MQVDVGEAVKLCKPYERIPKRNYLTRILLEV